MRSRSLSLHSKDRALRRPEYISIRPSNEQDLSPRLSRLKVEREVERPADESRNRPFVLTSSRRQIDEFGLDVGSTKYTIEELAWVLPN